MNIEQDLKTVNERILKLQKQLFDREIAGKIKENKLMAFEDSVVREYRNKINTTKTMKKYYEDRKVIYYFKGRMKMNLEIKDCKK